MAYKRKQQRMRPTISIICFECYRRSETVASILYVKGGILYAALVVIVVATVPPNLSRNYYFAVIRYAIL